MLQALARGIPPVPPYFVPYESLADEVAGLAMPPRVEALTETGVFLGRGIARRLPSYVEPEELGERLGSYTVSDVTIRPQTFATFVDGPSASDAAERASDLIERIARETIEPMFGDLYSRAEPIELESFAAAGVRIGSYTVTDVTINPETFAIDSFAAAGARIGDTIRIRLPEGMSGVEARARVRDMIVCPCLMCRTAYPELEAELALEAAGARKMRLEAFEPATVRAWCLENRSRDDTFDWHSPGICAMAQYYAAQGTTFRGVHAYDFGATEESPPPPAWLPRARDLNETAMYEPRTFGAFAERLELLERDGIAGVRVAMAADGQGASVREAIESQRRRDAFESERVYRLDNAAKIEAFQREGYRALV